MRDEGLTLGMIILFTAAGLCHIGQPAIEMHRTSCLATAEGGEGENVLRNRVWVPHREGAVRQTILKQSRLP